jgi:hypothetical protein
MECDELSMPSLQARGCTHSPQHCDASASQGTSPSGLAAYCHTPLNEVRGSGALHADVGLQLQSCFAQTLEASP